MTLDEARQILLEHKKLKQSPRGGVRWYASDEDAAHARRRYKQAHSIVWWSTRVHPPKKMTPCRKARMRARNRMGGGADAAVVAFYKYVDTAEAVICFWCRRKIAKDQRTVDHFMPLAKGGAHAASNLVAACKTCNSYKRDLIPDEFIHRVLPGIIIAN